MCSQVNSCLLADEEILNNGLRELVRSDIGNYLLRSHSLGWPTYLIGLCQGYIRYYVVCAQNRIVCPTYMNSTLKLKVYLFSYYAFLD